MPINVVFYTGPPAKETHSSFSLSIFALQGSRDNMSVVLVCFSAAPKISEEAVKKEEELDKYLETRVEGQHSEHTQTNLQTMTV